MEARLEGLKSELWSTAPLIGARNRGAALNKLMAGSSPDAAELLADAVERKHPLAARAAAHLRGLQPATHAAAIERLWALWAEKRWASLVGIISAASRPDDDALARIADAFPNSAAAVLCKAGRESLISLEPGTMTAVLDGGLRDPDPEVRQGAMRYVAALPNDAAVNDRLYDHAPQLHATRARRAQSVFREPGRQRPQPPPAGHASAVTEPRHHRGRLAERPHGGPRGGCPGREGGCVEGEEGSA